jgi:hypothetical protein
MKFLEGSNLKQRLEVSLMFVITDRGVHIVSSRGRLACTAWSATGWKTLDRCEYLIIIITNIGLSLIPVGL